MSSKSKSDKLPVILPLADREKLEQTVDLYNLSLKGKKIGCEDWVRAEKGLKKKVKQSNDYLISTFYESLVCKSGRVLYTAVCEAIETKLVGYKLLSSKGKFRLHPKPIDFSLLNLAIEFKPDGFLTLCKKALSELNGQLVGATLLQHGLANIQIADAPDNLCIYLNPLRWRGNITSNSFHTCLVATVRKIALVIIKTAYPEIQNKDLTESCVDRHMALDKVEVVYSHFQKWVTDTEVTKNLKYHDMFYLDDAISSFLCTVVPNALQAVLKSSNAKASTGKFLRKVEASKRLGNIHKAPEFSNEIIYLYKRHPSCKTKGHNILSATAYVECCRTDGKVPINVFHCTECKRWFIGQKSFQQYRMKYGLPFVDIEADEDVGRKYAFNTFDSFESQSILNLYGYNNVNANGPNEQQRHMLLAELIEFKLLSKNRIISHIEGLISLNGRKDGLARAVARWNTDLIFVNNYDLHRQAKVYGVILARAKQKHYRSV